MCALALYMALWPLAESGGLALFCERLLFGLAFFPARLNFKPGFASRLLILNRVLRWALNWVLRDPPHSKALLWLFI